MAGNRVAWRLYSVAVLVAGLAAWTAMVLLDPARTTAIGGPFSLWQGGPPVSSWSVLLALLAISWVMMHLKFAMPSGYFVTFDITFALAGFYLVGPLYGVLIALSTTCVDFLLRLRARGEQHLEWATLSDNAGNRLLRFAVAWAVYVGAGGTLPPTEEPRCMAAVALSFVAYFLTNNLLYLPSVVFKGQDLRPYLRESYREDLLHTATIFAMGYLLALVASGSSTHWASFGVLGLFVAGSSWVLNRLTGAQRDLKRRVEDLVLLGKVSSAANSGLDVMPMVEAFARELCHELGAEGIGVVFFHRYSSSVYLVQVEGEKSRSTDLPEEKRFQYEQLPLSEASVKLGERLFEFLQPLETAPFMIPKRVFGLPLLHSGEPFGGIVVYSNDERAEYSRRRELLETCAQSLTVGLENCFLHLQAIQDPLTGLYNRSYFLYRLEEELAYSTRHRAPFALMMVDLDDFKAVNDSLGHEVGDRVLRRIGDLFRAALRREDVPSRYGGDEFLLLLLNCDEAFAVEKAGRIRSLLGARALPKEESGGIALGCSVGLLTSTRLRGEQDVPTILRRLDQALYKAKAGGKNAVVLAD